MFRPLSSPAALLKDPSEVERLGHVGAVEPGHDDHLEVVAAPPDPAVHMDGDGRALLGEAALEFLADAAPRALAADPGCGTLRRT